MSFVSKLTGGLIAPGSRPANRRFLDASIGAAALVGTADGPIDFVKRSLLDKIIESVEALHSLEIHVVIDLFNARVAELQQNRNDARREILALVQPLAGDTRQGEIINKIACAMGRRDGSYSEAARAEIETIAKALGLATIDKGPSSSAKAPKKSRIIALANQKGGTGKSTMAVHLAIAMGQRGAKVGCIDLDSNQGTLSHYLANRKAVAEEEDEDIILPAVIAVEESTSGKRDFAEKDEEVRLETALKTLSDCDIIIIDTPGNQSNLASLGCIVADTLITPLNDSLLDIDVLAQIDPRKRLVLGPSNYSQRIWQENEQRATIGQPPLDWIVLRNRLAQFDAKNSREVASLLSQLADRLGFRLIHGMSERVIFRELFLRGLTLLDLPDDKLDRQSNKSHRNAREELDHLIDSIGLPATLSADTAVQATHG